MRVRNVAAAYLVIVLVIEVIAVLRSAGAEIITRKGRSLVALGEMRGICVELPTDVCVRVECRKDINRRHPRLLAVVVFLPKEERRTHRILAACLEWVGESFEASLVNTTESIGNLHESQHRRGVYAFLAQIVTEVERSLRRLRVVLVDFLVILRNRGASS